MTTPLDVLSTVCNLGGRLSVVGDKLRLRLPADSSPELKAAVFTHKSALLRLLRCTFVIVDSDALNEVVFFAADEETKTVLVDAGAKPGCVYTHEELRSLVDEHRHEPITPAELLRIHAAKRMFNGRIALKLGRA